MATVTISPKFQVVIPKDIRERLGLTPGQKVHTIMYNDRIELIPLRPMRKLRGYLEGIPTAIEQESDRV
jgi:AbrB family looped-hinge helix DNA binding protein